MSSWIIFAIGKPRLAYARSGIEEYARRLQPFLRIEIAYVPASKRDAESAALLRRSEGCLRVVLDERGELVSSRALAERIAGWQLAGTKRMAVLVGGAGGHSPALREAADWTWSLSPLTLQHELALVVTLEQIYRACSINAGHPYHRD